MKTVKIEVTEEDVQFLNQILGSVEINGSRVALNGLIQVLQKLNTPVQDNMEPVKEE